MEEQERFFPVLSHFLEDNPWYASEGRLRYRVIPTVENDPKDSILTVEVWEGPWAFEFSTVEETKIFPLSEEGREQIQSFLNTWSETISARPKRTMAEDEARRKGE